MIDLDAEGLARAKMLGATCPGSVLDNIASACYVVVLAGRDYRAHHGESPELDALMYSASQIALGALEHTLVSVLCN